MCLCCLFRIFAYFGYPSLFIKGGNKAASEIDDISIGVEMRWNLESERDFGLVICHHNSHLINI